MLNFCVARGTMSRMSSASGSDELIPIPSPPKISARVSAAPTALCGARYRTLQTSRHCFELPPRATSRESAG
jgi:hypothetical protein